MTLHSITVPERAFLNSDGQRSELFLAFTDTPPVIFTCRVKQTFATHDMVAQVIYDEPAGDLDSVLPGMTVFVGTDAGLYDVGIARVRKPWDECTIYEDGVMYIGEVSEIGWADRLYITVVDEMLLSPKHLRIVNQVPFMDFDVPYTDQHVKFDPVPIMGCNAVVDVDAYPVTVEFPEANRSWVFDSTISAWLWTATDGVLTDETTNEPTLTISEYPPDGLIRVALKLTSAAGAEYTGYRYVKVYDYEQDPYGIYLHRPVEVFQLGACQGDYGSGNFSFEVTLYGQAGVTEIRDRAPIVLFAKDYYGDDVVSVGQLAGRENIVALGWIDIESIKWDVSGGYVTFTVQGPAFWMGKMNAYPSGVRLAKKIPSAWTDMTALTVDRGLWHFFHWRTTATMILDVTLTGDVRIASEMKSPATSLWAQIAEMATSSIFATGGFDQYGRLFISIDPQAVPVADRTWTVIQEIGTDEWEDVDFDRITTPEVAQLALSGVAVDPTGGASAYFSLSPGHVFKKFGSRDTIERVLLSSQIQSNELCGLIVGWRNNPYPSIGVSFAQNNRMYTLFPPQFAHIEIAEEDTERKITLSTNLIPRSASYQWDAEAGVLTTQVGFEAETFPDLSVNGDVPNVITSASISSPPIGAFKLPPIPAMILPPTEVNPNMPEVIVIYSTTHGVMYTENANETDPAQIEWQSMNDGLDASERNEIGQLVVTPSGKLYIMTDGGPFEGWRKIFAADSVGATWYPVLIAQTDFPVPTSLINGIGVNPLEDDQIAVFGGEPWNPLGGGTEGSYYLSLISNSVFTLGPVLPGAWDYQDPRVCFAAVVFNNDGWTVFSNRGVFADPTAWRFDSTGHSITWTAMAGHAPSRLDGCSAGTQDLSFSWQNNVLYKVTVDGTVFTTLSIAPTTVQSVSFSPTGTHGMANDGTAVKKTTDGGASWLTTALTIGPNVFENCKDDNRWIFGGGANIRVTLDQGGASNVNIIGNLLYTAALINIVGARFIK